MIDRVNRSTGTYKRTNANLIELDSWHPGPFVGIVRNNLDPEYRGKLQVELLTKTKVGNIPNTETEWFTCKYLSPFYGKTPAEGTSNNAEDKYSQKSYGMWFVPPDIGTKVLVILAEGGEAFWMGCIVDDDINFMVPATDSVTTYNTEDGDTKLPVGERNIRQDFDGNDYTQVPKPVHSDFKNILEQQGLLSDETRGTNSSSARRDLPSAVFGISTPGPQDKRDGAPQIKGKLGSHKYHNRLGGSSFVMDDGDPTLLRKNPASTSPPEYANVDKDESDGDVTIPHNEMLRLKTRTGHQILMHNAEDLIYIGNAKGTAWVELTSNGKIDIYSEDSISVRTAQDLNFKADRDINFQADRDFNVRAKKNITVEAEQEDFQLIVGRNNQITTGGFLHINTENNTRIKSNTSNIDILAEESLHIESVKESTNILSEKNNNFTTTTGDTSILSGGRYLASTGNNEDARKEGRITYHMNDGNAPPRAASIALSATQAAALTTWTVSQGETETIMRRVPAREPWLSHENLAPLNFAPEETDIKKLNEAATAITSIPPTEGEYKFTADTFRKGKD